MTRLTEKIDELKVITIFRILKVDLWGLTGVQCGHCHGIDCEGGSYFLDVHSMESFKKPKICSSKRQYSLTHIIHLSCADCLLVCRTFLMG